MLPHAEYVNAVYVYPSSVYLGDARNICVAVEIRDSDEDLKAPGTDSSS